MFSSIKLPTFLCSAQVPLDIFWQMGMSWHGSALGPKIRKKMKEALGTIAYVAPEARLHVDTGRKHGKIWHHALVIQ